MTKSRAIIAIFSVCIVLMGISYIKQLNVKHFSGEEGFAAAAQASGEFYKLFREALDNEKRGEDQKAIELFNGALPLARIGIEKGMVYHELIKIYRKNGDLKRELECLELFPKYSMNQKLIKDASARVEQIKKIS